MTIMIVKIGGRCFMNLFGLRSLLPAVPETRQSKLRTTVSFRDGRRKNLKEEGELVVFGQAADAKRSRSSRHGHHHRGVNTAMNSATIVTDWEGRGEGLIHAIASGD